MKTTEQVVEEMLTRLDEVEQRLLDTLLTGLQSGIQDLYQHENNGNAPKLSPCRGVGWCPEKNLWRARVYERGGYGYHLGYFQEMTWAVEAAERERRRLEDSGLRRPQVSTHCGVTLDKRVNRWRSRITVDGKVLSLGQYASEEVAAQCYDHAVLASGLPRPLNFPDNRGQGEEKGDGPCG